MFNSYTSLWNSRQWDKEIKRDGKFMKTPFVSFIFGGIDIGPITSRAPTVMSFHLFISIYLHTDLQLRHIQNCTSKYFFKSTMILINNSHTTYAILYHIITYLIKSSFLAKNDELLWNNRGIRSEFLWFNFRKP